MQDILRSHFEKFYNTVKFDPEQFKEILWKFYLQGHNDPTPVGEDISDESVKEMVERQNFLDFMESCIADPNAPAPFGQTVNANDYVEVVCPCSVEDKQKCVAYPDRCEGECKRLINLSKLCGVESGKSMFIKDTSLVSDKEAKLLSEVLTNYFKQ